MNKIYILLSAFFIYCLPLGAQLKWQHNFGGAGYDAIVSVAPTSDSGTISAGYTISTDGDITTNHSIQYNTDAWVIKQKADGTVEWQKCYGGHYSEYAYSVLQTPDGGYMVAGSANSGDGDVVNKRWDSLDVWILKLKKDGTIEWQKTYGGYGNEEAHSISATSDGGFIVGGYSTSDNGDLINNHGNKDFWIFKIKADGTLVWQANYGGSDDDEVNSVAATSDGGCVATGYTKSSNKNVVNNNGWVDIWVVKLKNDGSLDWSRAIGGGSYDNAYCIIPTLDTAYVLAGVTMSRSGDVQHPFAKKDSSSAWIIKLSEQGSIIWEKVYGGAKANGASWIVQTPRNHEYLFCGSTNSKNGDVKFNHGGTDAWVVKLERDTILQWEYTYGGSDYDNADCITIRKDNSYAFVGESKSSDGDLSGNIQSSYDGWVVILDGATAGIEAAANNDMGRLYPNPVINSLHLDLKGQNQRGAVMISDISGRELYNESVESKNINLDVSGFKSGVYLIRFQSNGMLWNGKFIKE